MTTHKTQPEIVELDDSMWVDVGQHDLHECCFCSAEHRVEIRWNKEKHKLQERWILTKQPRRRRKK